MSWFKTVLSQVSIKVYKCPDCGEDAFNGDLEKGTLFRGSARCSGCGHSFSILRMEGSDCGRRATQKGCEEARDTTA